MPPRAGQRRNVTIVGSSGIITHDPLSDCPTFMSEYQRQIHAGTMYQFTGTASLGSGGIKNLIITTPNTTTWSHLSLKSILTARGASANVAIYHTTVTSNDETGVSVINMNLNSGISHISSAFEDPTVGTLGSLAHQEFITSGTKALGVNPSEDELILKQNTKHLIRLTSEGANNELSWIVRWCEHNNI